eukprot:9485399-Pyramimonas_sp.AAC.1
MQHPDCTGADADAKASKMVADMFVSLRGALAYALITPVWLTVYVVSCNVSKTRPIYGCGD